MEQLFRKFLEHYGEDVTREGLVDTPDRMTRMYKELFCGLHDPPPDIRIFTEEGNDSLVVVKDIPFYSVCEHHIIPFFGTTHLGYLPKDNRVAGLSKFVRVVRHFAARPQIQERLVSQIADFIMEKVKPKGCVVYMEARHLCMEMRGARAPGTITVTNAI